MLAFEPGIECASCGGWMDFTGVDAHGDGHYFCFDEFCGYGVTIDPDTGKEVGTGL